MVLKFRNLKKIATMQQLQYLACDLIIPFMVYWKHLIFPKKQNTNEIRVQQISRQTTTTNYLLYSCLSLVVFIYTVYRLVLSGFIDFRLFIKFWVWFSVTTFHLSCDIYFLKKLQKKVENVFYKIYYVNSTLDDCSNSYIKTDSLPNQIQSWMKFKPKFRKTISVNYCCL